ncbi:MULTISPECIES: ribonuclease P protein component [Ancylobacter]|uniref:Ribonuclease P protein component n=2 Tax=Ancylobacter TaxID=99 RepID=A0A839ZF26_9HYPH|nr:MULTISPECIES: ribonuclease P protein component [Ancylobacter]MBB3773298.1 ribonuclease P protein component [Ancylobacter tetraedralis]MDQ0512700.1 ribonuclease P protein component [Ancylobacter amanitiformis]
MDRIVKRKDFVAAASGLRANSGALLLQGRARADEHCPRIGLTVTKKHGNAVERNRIRRRLRAAVRDALPRAGKSGFDYVIVARRAALGVPFADLINDIERGIARLHSGSRRPPRPARDSAAQPVARADGEKLP